MSFSFSQTIFAFKFVRCEPPLRTTNKNVEIKK